MLDQQAASHPASLAGLGRVVSMEEGDMALKAYDDLHGVAQRLMKTNRRLPLARALWLAEHWAARNADGRWEVLGDPAHKVTSATLYRVEEALAIYRRITAPTLSVTASGDSLAQWWKGRYSLADYRERIAQIPHLREAVIDDAGHMIHHDQPEALARLIEDFLAPE